MKRKAVAIAGLIGVMLAACSAPEPPARVAFALDGSGSAAGTAKSYIAGANSWLADHDEDLAVTAFGLTGGSGDQQTCPPAEQKIIGEGNNGDVAARDREDKRAKFSAKLTRLAVCIDANRGGSDLVAFESLASRLGAGGTAVLFTDAMIYLRNGPRVQRRTLTDPAKDAKFLAQFDSAARIDGINVEVRGAGGGAGLTDAELAGLHRRWRKLIESKGGTLTDFDSGLIGSNNQEGEGR